MSDVTVSQIRNALAWRYATKRFDPARHIEDATWDVLLESLRLAPSSFGLQPWKFVVVGDRTLRQRLRTASWDQPQVTDADRLVVLARRSPLSSEDVREHLRLTAEVRAVPISEFSGYQRMIEGFMSRPGFDVDAWAARQVYIALGGFLSTAAMLRVDACPMEGIDPLAYDEVLALPNEGYRTTVVAAVGYRAADDANAHLAKVRFSRERVTSWR
ncbi:MAG: NAD(P)H-dependent oxidoreductase [Phycisphaerae bacterium]|jgi:nitroreductase|nr:NAD(P)H-dependent oxidoreductase [Phycisphaerae bacterium]